MIIQSKMTTPSKPGKQPIPVWEAIGCAEFEKQLLLSIGGRRWKGAISFFEDPTEAIEELKNAGRWHPEEALGTRIEHLEGKIEKRAEWAKGRKEKSTKAYERSNKIGERFYMGQPILVGHHSEKGARRDQKRMHDAMDKCLEHSDMAERHASVAETHEYAIKRLNNSPRYWANKIKKFKHRINQLNAWLEGRYYISKSAYNGSEGVKLPSEAQANVWREQIEAIKIDLNFAEKTLIEVQTSKAS